jgi:hypothetical protein
LKALFSVCSNSLSRVQYSIESKLGKDSTRLVTDSWKKVKTSKILLIPGVNLLKVHAKPLAEWKGVAIVFDGPINLYGIKNLQWLDVKRGDNTISYHFEFIEPNYQRVFDAWNNKEANFSVKFRKNDILSTLVIERSETELKRKLHNFLYFCTNHTNRSTAKKHVMNYLNSKVDLAKTAISLRSNLRPDSTDYYLKDLLEFLKSDSAISLKKAYKNVKSSEDILRISTKQKVDVRDMRYIYKTLKSKPHPGASA